MPHRPNFQTVLSRLLEMRKALPGPTSPFRSYEVITDVMQQMVDKRERQNRRSLGVKRKVRYTET